MSSSSQRRLSVALGIAIACALVSSCSGPELRSEREIRDLTELRARWDAILREESSVACACCATHPPHSVHVTSVVGGADRLVILVHGMLSDSRRWAHLAGALGGRYGLLLVDLPGCGGSDSPEPDQVGEEFYSPTHLARCLGTALRSRLADLPPATAVTIVAHSLGGLVIFRLLGDPALREEFADVVARLDRTMVIDTPDFAIHKVDEKLLEVATIGGFTVWLGDLVGMVAAASRQVIHDSFTDPRRATQEDADLMHEILTDGPRRRALQSMIKRAVPFDPETLRPDWEGILELVSHYASFEKPCLILFGQRDETMPATMGYKLQAQLPRAKLLVLRRAMHSPHLEHPTFIARIVAAYVDHGFDDLPSIAEVEPPDPVAPSGPLEGTDWPSILGGSKP